MNPVVAPDPRALIKARSGAYPGICPRCGKPLPDARVPACASMYAEAQICVDCNCEEIIGSNILPLEKWWIIHAPEAVQNSLF